MSKHAKLQQKNPIFFSSTSFYLIMKNQFNFWYGCYGNCYFQNVSYMILWRHFEKNIFWKKNKRKFKSFVSIHPHLSTFTITSKETIFRLELLETIQPFVVMEIQNIQLEKLEKKKGKDLANKFILRQNRQLSIIKILSQVSIVAIESKLVSILPTRRP